MLDLSFTKPDEMAFLLCDRLRKERINQQMTQSELAKRAGIGVNTLSNLESGKNTGFENIIRVAMVLGRTAELEGLFKPRLESLEDLRRYESTLTRKRIRSKGGHNE
ncbi:TPA: helix-turn-helix transcriptional regulator [Raoultella ornithinolytica]|uniref:helix-turn-helix transcriptional regulator n=1 Tax=Raoultella ornithinolytica TaxID=54291 RepID=UPI00293684FB|nr:helix-turn-helix transcriptional regulator [Raoultella ornithinolytica]HEC2606567.1 helix-turn-helix transcriptional regulator [Raoultella ornithinolytica]